MKTVHTTQSSWRTYCSITVSGWRDLICRTRCHVRHSLIRKRHKDQVRLKSQIFRSRQTSWAQTWVKQRGNDGRKDTSLETKQRHPRARPAGAKLSCQTFSCLSSPNFQSFRDFLLEYLKKIRVMARSKKFNGEEVKGRTPSPESERPAGPLSIVVPPEARDVVKVNHYNTTELKNACDDALRRVSDSCLRLACASIGTMVSESWRFYRLVSITTRIVQTNSPAHRHTPRAGLAQCVCCRRNGPVWL